MIFVDIMGGLGNQLFQYATAKSLSIDKNADFMMNLSSYKKDTSKSIAHIDFKLDHFNIGAFKQFDEHEINQYDNVKKIIEPLSSDNFVKFIDFNKYSGNLYLKGYWQDERYFKHNEHIIKKDLKIITPPNKKNKKMIEEIKLADSVCLSFRRGEYLDPYFIAQFGMCTEDYYKKAIDFISKKIKNPTFFIFSDDTDWIEDNVKLDYPVIPITFNGANEVHEELRLMTYCKYFILANSSFSWWGAWLSDYKEKIVFAPTPWFNSFTKQPILCANWIHINCDRKKLFEKSNSKIFELVTEKDYKKIKCKNIETTVGKFGIKLKIKNTYSKIGFSLNNITNNNEYLIEFKLFSKRKGLIKINYGIDRNVILGYPKGNSIKYLHLANINLNDVILKMDDTSLFIENITIKKVDSNYNLLLNNKS